MTRTIVLAGAILLSLVPALVRAQDPADPPSTEAEDVAPKPAGVAAGASQDPDGAAEPEQEEQTPPGDETAETEPGAAEPRPAGVPAAEAPKDDADGAHRDAHGDAHGEEPAAQTDPGASGPRPAGVPAAEAPKDEADGEQESGTMSRVAPRPAGMGSARAFRGMFGGAAPAGLQTHSLDLSASLFGIHVEGDRSRLPVGDDVVPARTSTYGGASASLTYGRLWPHASIGASGSASRAYITSRDRDGADPWVDRWSVGGNAAIDRKLSTNVSVQGRARAHYSPYFQQDLLSRAAIPTVGGSLGGVPGLDFTLARDPSVLSAAGGALSYRVSDRGSVNVHYDLVRRDFVSSDSPSYFNQVVGGRYTHRLNRWVGLRAGYGYRTASYGGPGSEPVASHELDLGADGGYGRSVALTRRTTFSFNTGSSLFLRGSAREVATDQTFNQRSRFHLNGSADLVHGWGRSWSANVGARRSINYEFGFPEPLLSNAFHAGVGGLLAPRLDFTSTFAYTAGAVGFGSNENGFATSSATVALRLALTRHLATYAQYFDYRYEFERGVTLPGFLQRDFGRRGVTVGLTAWLPLIGSRGRP